MNKPTTKKTFKKYITSGAFARDTRENSWAVTMAYEKIIKEDVQIHKIIDVDLVDKKTK